MTCIQRFGAANLELFRADMNYAKLIREPDHWQSSRRVPTRW
jgi:hypothetical protein